MATDKKATEANNAQSAKPRRIATVKGTGKAEFEEGKSYKLSPGLARLYASQGKVTIVKID